MNTTSLAVLDSTAGVSLVVAAVLGWRSFRSCAVFALLAGAAWFVGTAVPALVLLHRPLLVHSLLGLSRGARARPERGALLVAAWTTVALPPTLQSPASVVTAILCLATALRLQTAASGSPQVAVSAAFAGPVPEVAL